MLSSDLVLNQQDAHRNRNVEEVFVAVTTFR
jgi:hypothetical protein